MCIWIVGGMVPVTGMLAGMNLSKPGMNLSKPRMNLSKPGEKHTNHVLIVNKSQEPLIYRQSYNTHDCTRTGALGVCKYMH